MVIMDKDIAVSGRFPRTARLKDEYYEWLDDPHTFVANVKAGGVGADLFTFLPRLADTDKRYDFYYEVDSIAVVPISTYENWWKKQINDKTRNMIRRAQKSSVEIRHIDFDDDLVKQIKDIYDESPLRQGKPFTHYGKDLATIRKTHITFLDRSEFIGAFFQGELIGFIKLVHDEGVSHLMQIIAKIEHRSKAPTNALIAKAVEICAERRVPYLRYGIWSRRGLGDFKKHHAFERFDLRRYFVPLNSKGRLMLRLGLHHTPRVSEHLPEKWVNVLADLRGQWNSFKMTRNLKGHKS